jgi:hypothetical protein
MAARMEMPQSEPAQSVPPGTMAAQVGTPPVRSARRATTPRSSSASLVVVGVIVALVAAWGGIVAYVGPTFGFSGDGSAAWRWTSSHLFLALLPGILGLVAGLLLICVAPLTAEGRGRADLVLLGGATVVGGAWFAVGPWAWPVLRSVGPYFVVATPFRVLTFELGYALGPGLVLMACGGFVIGWAARHRPDAGPATVPAAVSPTLVAVPMDGGAGAPVAGAPVASAPDVGVPQGEPTVGAPPVPPAPVVPSTPAEGRHVATTRTTAQVPSLGSPRPGSGGGAPAGRPDGWTVDRL